MEVNLLEKSIFFTRLLFLVFENFLAQGKEKINNN